MASGKRRYARCTCVRSQAINRSDYPRPPFTFEDELFSQLQFWLHGARHQDLGASPNLGRTAPVCTPQQQRSAAGAQQQRCGLSGWAVTHMGQSHVGHTAHTHTHTHTAHPPSLVYTTQCTYPTAYATHSHTHGMLGCFFRGGLDLGDKIQQGY